MLQVTTGRGFPSGSIAARTINLSRRRLRPEESGVLRGPEVELHGRISVSVGDHLVFGCGQGADSRRGEWDGVLVGIREIQIIRLDQFVAGAGSPLDADLCRSVTGVVGEVEQLERGGLGNEQRGGDRVESRIGGRAVQTPLIEGDNETACTRRYRKRGVIGARPRVVTSCLCQAMPRVRISTDS